MAKLLINSDRKVLASQRGKIYKAPKGGGSGSSSVDIVKPIYAEQKIPVPNTGHIEKIFFNTSLTTDQVDALIANANLTTIDMDGLPIYPILSTNTISIMILDYAPMLGVESGSAWAIGNLFDDTLYYCSPAIAATGNPVPVGWAESPFDVFDTGEIAIRAELIQEEDGMTAGSQNNLITELVYSERLLTDTGEVETVKTLSNQYKLIEQNITLDAESTSYSYDFVNNINEDTKEIKVIKNIGFITKENAIIDRTVTTYANNKVDIIGDAAFYNCDSLTNVSFPKAINVGNSAFYHCFNLVDVNIPLVRSIGDKAFYSCSNLVDVNIPLVRSIGSQAFYNCASLTKVFLSQTTFMCVLKGENAFAGCSHILGTKDSIHNPEGLKDGYIYVPASSLSNYKVAHDWATYASQIIGHEYLEAGATLPDYTMSGFHTQTWYSDEKLTTPVTSVTTSGTYYCRLER